jgi:HD-GYP domain-containing protein (c-di-GMP phosphodiesterase class II)
VLIKNAIYKEKSFDFEKLARDLIDLIPSVQPVLTDNYFIVNDSSAISGYSYLYPKPYRFLAVRVEHHGEVYGWLGLTAFNIDEIFRQSELRLLSSMAEQIAMVIANTELYHDMERFIINVVRSLVYAIEAKDFYTKGHSERVNRYCMMIADKLKMEKDDKNFLHWASILHDVGKIGIPEAILNKPDLLDTEEYNLIKTHPQKGIEILRPIEQLAGSLPGILHHHERWDGKGYPLGLKGEKIPLVARIIGIADTFDALTTNRAYRDAINFHEALSIMEKATGSQLDAHLFKIFKKIFIID